MNRTLVLNHLGQKFQLPHSCLIFCILWLQRFMVWNLPPLLGGFHLCHLGPSCHASSWCHAIRWWGSSFSQTKDDENMSDIIDTSISGVDCVTRYITLSCFIILGSRNDIPQPSRLEPNNYSLKGHHSQHSVPNIKSSVERSRHEEQSSSSSARDMPPKHNSVASDNRIRWVPVMYCHLSPEHKIYILL